MNAESSQESLAAPDSADAELKYYRHPSANSNTYYAAYGPNRLRVKRGEQWGEFDRNGLWLAGELRFADPTFCRWVSGEHIYNARLIETKCELFSVTRLAQIKSGKQT